MFLLPLLLITTGCIGPQTDDQIRVTIGITEQAGIQPLAWHNATLAPNTTVLEALENVTTYNATPQGFVHTINGTQADPANNLSWFYHVNTTAATVGATQSTLDDGDHVLWDLRSYSHTFTVPHLLTGLDTWPATVPTEPTPDAWTNAASHGNLFATINNDTLTLLDHAGNRIGTLQPPWLVLHTTNQPGPSPGFILEASGPNATDLIDRITQDPPQGVGLVLTPQHRLSLPAPTTPPTWLPEPAPLAPTTQTDANETNRTKPPTNASPTNQTDPNANQTNTTTNTTGNVTVQLTVETNHTAQAGLDPGENSDLPGTAACNVTIPADSNGAIVLEAANQTGCIDGWRADSFDEGGRFIVMIDQLEAPGYTCLAFQAGLCDFWQHRVNGSPASYGIDGYQAQDGDHVRWLYRNTA